MNLNDTAGIAIVGAFVPVTNTTLRNNTITDERVPVWRYDPSPQPSAAASQSPAANRQVLFAGVGVLAVAVIIGLAATLRRAR